MRNNPCFDMITKTDCPDRKAGCAVTCPKWAEYEREREKEYHDRQVEYEVDRAIQDHRNKTYAAHLKKKSRQSRYVRRNNH